MASTHNPEIRSYVLYWLRQPGALITRVLKIIFSNFLIHNYLKTVNKTEKEFHAYISNILIGNV